MVFRGKWYRASDEIRKYKSPNLVGDSPWISPKLRGICPMDHGPTTRKRATHLTAKIFESSLRPIQNQIINWFQASFRTVGLIKIYSPTNRLFYHETIGHQSEDRETIIIFHPARWLLKLGMAYGWRLLNQSQQGWKYCLNQFRAVLDDALIFELSREGNIIAVETLIRRGEASVWDTNSQGFTPPHVGYGD